MPSEEVTDLLRCSVETWRAWESHSLFVELVLYAGDEVVANSLCRYDTDFWSEDAIEEVTLLASHAFIEAYRL